MEFPADAKLTESWAKEIATHAGDVAARPPEELTKVFSVDYLVAFFNKLRDVLAREPTLLEVLDCLGQQSSHSPPVPS